MFCIFLTERLNTDDNSRADRQTSIFLSLALACLAARLSTSLTISGDSRKILSSSSSHLSVPFCMILLICFNLAWISSLTRTWPLFSLHFLANVSRRVAILEKNKPLGSHAIWFPGWGGVGAWGHAEPVNSLSLYI